MIRKKNKKRESEHGQKNGHKTNRKSKTKQNKTKQNKTKQNKTKQNKTKQNKTKQTKQNETKQQNKTNNKIMQQHTELCVADGTLLVDFDEQRGAVDTHDVPTRCYHGIAKSRFLEADRTLPDSCV